MSDLANKKSAPRVTESLSAATSLGAQPKSKIKPVHLWAALGGAILVFQLYVWISWLTGPNFERVPAGPSEPPMFMKVVLVTLTIFCVVGLPIAIYYFIVRPWRRERRITLDGMLVGAMGLMLFQDPLLNYNSTWSTYNTWLWNRGSWVQDIPGWVSFGEPGAMMAEPVLINIGGYAFIVLLCVISGCWVMRKVKQRWPNISNVGLVGVVVAYCIFFDLVMEGMIFLPMGFFTYPGAIQALSLNAGTYYQWPIYEGLMWGGVQAGLTCLRFFTDDRGRTFVERGLDSVRGGFVRQQFIRFLAISAACSTFFFVLYNIPAQWFAMHQDPWPEDILKRSYFLMGICGEQTDRPCPDPALPVPLQNSGYINHDGQLVLPEGVELPVVVPVEGGN